MKIKILFVLLFVTVTICRAQFETGKKVISGQFGIALSKGSEISSVPGNFQQSGSFSSSLSLSKFKTPLLLNGFGFNYDYNSYESNPGFNGTQSVYNNNIGLFVNTIKLQPLAKNIYLSFTGTTGAAYSFGKSALMPSRAYTKTKGYTGYVWGGLGLLYQLNKRFLLTCNLSNLLNLTYTHSDITSYNGTTENTGSGNSISLSSGLNGFSLNSIGIGVKYMLK